MIQAEQRKRDRKLVLRLINGENKRMVAATSGLSTQQIGNLLKKYGLPTKQKDLTSDLKCAILDI